MLSSRSESKPRVSSWSLNTVPFAKSAARRPPRVFPESCEKLQVLSRDSNASSGALVTSDPPLNAERSMRPLKRPATTSGRFAGVKVTGNAACAPGDVTRTSPRPGWPGVSSLKVASPSVTTTCAPCSVRSTSPTSQRPSDASSVTGTRPPSLFPFASKRRTVTGTALVPSAG